MKCCASRLRFGESEMNSKRAKKLRWYARVQEAMMPDQVISPQGIPSTLLVYNHPRKWKDQLGNEHTFVNRTIQYNPRTSGKGFYKALKGKNANIRGSIAFVRYMCQKRIIELLAARNNRVAPADVVPEQQPAAAL